MIELGKKYEQRNGRDAKVFMTDGGGTYPVIGAILDCDGDWVPACWSTDGFYKMGEVLNRDLIEVKPERTVWLNIYGREHPTKESADKVANGGRRIACVPVTFREGEGL